MRWGKYFLSGMIATLVMLSSVPTAFIAKNVEENWQNENSKNEGLYLIWSEKVVGKIIRDYGKMKIVYADELSLKRTRCIYYPADYMRFLGIGDKKFDPLECTPAIPKKFQKENTHLYIVQFNGPPTYNDLSELKKLAKIIWYIPHNAYLVYVKTPLVLKNLENVRWVGRYEPYYKFSEDIYNEYLKSILITGHSYSNMIVDGGDNILATIVVYDNKLPVYRFFKPIYVYSFGKFIYMHGFLNIKNLPKLAREDNILYIGKYVEPKLCDELSTEIVGGSYPQFGALVHQHGLMGDGVVVAIADTGIDTGSSGIVHPDLKDNVIAIWDASGGDGHDGYGHGTHCAGIIAGTAAVRLLFPEESADEAGYYYGLGVAPSAKLVAEKIFSDSGSWLGASPTDMAVFAESNGAVISSNSWGAAVNGAYDDFAQMYDALTRDANPYINGTQPILFVFAAGNEGPSSQTISSPGSAKNVLTVGACGNDRFGDTHEMIADFSSRGPTEDGRIKPDVVAPGTWVASALSQAASAGWGWGNINRWYEWCGGTSQATPHGAGSAAIFVQYYEGLYGKKPSPSMIKAALIVSAVDLTGTDAEDPIPNNNEGWGMICLPNIIDPPYGEMFLDSPVYLETGEEYTLNITVVDTFTPLKITMAYTDREGAVNANPALVNDLNLVVEDPNGNIYIGNNFQNGWTQPGNAPSDSINNVECVYIQNPVAGKYKIRVLAQNIPMDSVPSTPEIDQDFSIAIIGGIEQYQHYSAVTFGKNCYKPGDTIDVKVIDFYANTNPNVNDRVTVTLESGKGDVEEINLIESAPNSGVFLGSILSSLSNVQNGNGVIEVNVTDTITAKYWDFLGSWRCSSTTVDGIPPSIINLTVLDVKSTVATIYVETSEPTILQLYYGTSGFVTNISYDSTNTVHTVTLRNLIPWTDYYFYVYVEDIAGNGFTDDNNSNYYHFRTTYPPDILVVADDGGYFQYSTGLLTYQLDVLGVSYDVWDTSLSGSPSLKVLNSYLIVFWNCGPAWSDTLSTEDQNNLIAYMNNGGRLVLMGQDILWDLGGLTPLFTDYFHISNYYQDWIEGYSTTVYGIAGNPITGNYTSGLILNSTYYLYIDELVNDGSAEVSDIFNDEYDYSIGVMVNNTTYRAIYMAFPYECLVIDEESAAIDITYKILNWLLPPSDKDIISIYSYGDEYSILGDQYTAKVLVVNKDSVAHTINVSMEITEYDSPPLVGFISPNASDILSGTATVEVVAKDDHGIDRVEIYIDSNLVATLTTSPYTTTINTENYPNGQHELRAVAYDTKNQSSEAAITVSFFNLNQTDSFGYHSSATTYSWIDVRGNSSSQFIGGGDDDAYSIDLPFNFQYYDQTLTSIYVCTNGFISMEYATDYSNDELPTSSVNYIIPVFWDDMKAYTSDQGIYRLNTTINGQNAVVIEWYIQHWGADSYGIFNFEAILFQNGTIIFQYNNTFINHASYDYGASATVGIQGGDGSLGYIQISYNMDVIRNGMAIKFTPPWTLKIPNVENNEQIRTSSIPAIEAVYSTNVTVNIPPKSAVWVYLNWTPTTEGIYVVNISADTVPGENIIFNNKASYMLYVREFKGTINVGVLDSWAADYSQYSSLQKIQDEWYKFGNYRIVFDLISLNKDEITLDDIINSSSSVLMISNAWSSSNGWEFSDSEISAVKVAVSMGYGIIGTSGTFDSANAPNNMKLAPIFGLNESVEGYWADTVTTISAVNYSHYIFNNLPPSFQIGYSYACVGLVNDSAKIIGETDSGQNTDLKGILTENRYGGGVAIYIPYMTEVMYANSYDLTLLYNSIFYVYNNSARPTVDMAAVGIYTDKEWVRPGKVINVTVKCFNAGNTTGTANATLYAIYEDSTQVIVGTSSFTLQPSRYFTVTYSFSPSKEGRITLKLVVNTTNDDNMDNNEAYYQVYCRVPHGPILVAGVDSLGAKFPDIMVWNELASKWYVYGNYTIMYDMNSLVDKNITYDDINYTHADVLVISDAWRNIPDSNIWWEFGDSEIAAIKRYVSEGHGLVMTSGTLNTNYVPNNMKLAPLAGLNESASQEWATSFSGVFNVNTSYAESAYLFRYIPTAYQSGSTYTTYGWELNTSDPADLVALSTDSTAGVFFHKYGLGSVVYFSHIPEYAADANDYDKQLVYNSIIFTYLNSTQPVVDNTPPQVSIISLTNGEVVEGTISIEVAAHDDVSFVTSVVIHIFNSSIDVSFKAKYDYLSGTFKGSYDTTLLGDGPYTVSATAYDRFGNANTTYVSIEVDNSAPVLTIVYPQNWMIISDTDITVDWKYNDSHMDGVAIEIDGGRWIDLGLATNYTFYNVSYGVHVLVLKAWDILGHTTYRKINVRVIPYDITVSPTGIVNARTVRLYAEWSNETILNAIFYIDEIKIPQSRTYINNSQAYADVPFLLNDGKHECKVSLTGINLSTMNTSYIELNWTFIVDATPPNLTITSPPNGNLPLTYNSTMWINGTTDPGCSIYINGMAVNVSSNGSFSHKVNLTVGFNVFTVIAVDSANNTAVEKVTALYLPQIPQILENITALWENISALWTTVNWMNDTLAQLQTNVSYIWENITTIYSRLSALQNTLQENVTRLENAIQENRTEIIGMLQENVTRLENEIQNVSSDLSAQIENLRNELHNEVNRLDARIDKLEGNVTYLHSQVDSLWNALDENITNLQNALGENYTALLNAMNNITALMNDLNLLSDYVDEQLANLKNKNAEQDSGILMDMILAIVAIILAVVGIVLALRNRRPKIPQEIAREEKEIHTTEEKTEEKSEKKSEGIELDVLEDKEKKEDVDLDL